jgi:hypothetical protein
MTRLVHYLALARRDAAFVSDMARIAKRYLVTAK